MRVIQILRIFDHDAFLEDPIKNHAVFFSKASRDRTSGQLSHVETAGRPTTGVVQICWGSNVGNLYVAAMLCLMRPRRAGFTEQEATAGELLVLSSIFEDEDIVGSQEPKIRPSSCGFVRGGIQRFGKRKFFSTVLSV